MKPEDLKMKLVEQVEAYLNEDDWNFEYDDSRAFFKMGLALKSKLKGVMIYIICRESGITFWFVLTQAGDEASAGEIMEFMTRANYRMVNGCFEMDLNDYEIRYRIFLPCEEVPSAELIRLQIGLGAATVQRYGDELLAVLFGMKSAAEAIKAVEGSDED